MIKAITKLTNGHEMHSDSLYERLESLRKHLLKFNVISKGDCYSPKNRGTATLNCDMAFDVLKDRVARLRTPEVMEYFGQANYLFKITEFLPGDYLEGYVRLEVWMR